MTSILKPTHFHPVIWGVIGLLMLAPLIAMQFTREVNWTGFDFAVAGLLLGSAGLAIKLIVGSKLTLPVKAALSGVALALLTLVWAQGAVDIL